MDQLVWLLALSTGGTKLLMVSVGAAVLKGALSRKSRSPPAKDSNSSRVSFTDAGYVVTNHVLHDVAGRQRQ
jgi:hypothetical protein